MDYETENIVKSTENMQLKGKKKYPCKFFFGPSGCKKKDCAFSHIQLKEKVIKKMKLD